MVGLGGVKLYTYHEMLDLVVIDGTARGIVVRDMRTGEIRSHAGHAVISTSTSGFLSRIVYTSR
jgi:succinate dehydrogenase / fumarate reductase flavoprotein subunit